MIWTSEVGVSVSIDNISHLDEIVNDLKQYGLVSIDKNMCIICVVGYLEWQNISFEAKTVAAMKDIPVRMISYGESDYNISFLVKEYNKSRFYNLSAITSLINANQDEVKIVR